MVAGRTIECAISYDIFSIKILHLHCVTFGTLSFVASVHRLVQKITSHLLSIQLILFTIFFRLCLILCIFLFIIYFIRRYQCWQWEFSIRMWMIKILCCIHSYINLVMTICFLIRRSFFGAHCRVVMFLLYCFLYHLVSFCRDLFCYECFCWIFDFQVLIMMLWVLMAKDCPITCCCAVSWQLY